MTSDNATTVPCSDPIPADVWADVEAVFAAISAGKPIDPDVGKRVREAAERNREAIYQRHGLLDIAVPAIREFRDRE